MLLATLAWFSAAFVDPSPAVPDTPLRADAVIVIGALHELHAREPEFSHAALNDAIVAFRPDIMVLEVRPDELAGRSGTPGRPEYPAVIWPLLASYRGRSVAMEPGGETFKRLSTAAGAAFAEFRRADAAGASLLSKLESAVDDILLAHWTSPGKSQDKTTEAVVRAVQDLRSSLVGPAFVKVQAQWDGYMAGRAREAVAANPGRRVLVLASFRNRGLIEERIRGVAPARLIDATRWLDLVERNRISPGSDQER